MAILTKAEARLSSTVGILADIHKEDCNLAIWQRAPLPLIATLPLQHIKPLRFCTKLAELESALHTKCEMAGYPSTPARQGLIRDIVELTNHYCSILNLTDVQVRLDIVTTDSCRKFHGDYVKARLITTYAGTGTQWLDSANAARIDVGKEPERINTLNTGDVGLFKGRMWSENPAIHRSPPIGGTGEHRLILVLDPVLER